MALLCVVIFAAGCQSGVNQLNKSAEKIDHSAEIQKMLADKATSAFEEGADPRPFPSGNQRRGGQDSGGSVERAGGDDESGRQNAVVGGNAGESGADAFNRIRTGGTDLPDTLHPDRRGDQQGAGLGGGVDTDPIYPQGKDGRQGGGQWRGDSGGQGSNSSESGGVPDLRSGVRESAEGGEKAAESDNGMTIFEWIIVGYFALTSQVGLVAIGWIACLNLKRTLTQVVSEISSDTKGA